MGKRGNKRGRGGYGGGRGRGGEGRPARGDYVEIPKINQMFEDYYNGLALVDEDEKEEFWTTLRRDLPNSFRFTGSKGQALPVQQLLKDRYIPEITSIEHNGELVAPPTPISWFPDQLAWQMTTPKNIVRRFPPFASFQKFLVSETSVGNISRQEVVSMIPPLLMNIKPGMTVLDMCASPGSKAAQLIEMVHNGEEARVRKVLRRISQERGREPSPESGILKVEIEEEEKEVDGDWSDEGRATGLLIANDVDYKRAQMLTHQMKRLNSPNLIVTNHDATMYPSIRIPSDSGSDVVATRARYLKFDRILADVPCSGDGTCRKNLHVWRDWTPGNALGLHPTQVRILIRALQMLKVGGRVVYSTCSLNPIENEAVVAAAIERCGGTSKVDLVDCNMALPSLKRKPGMETWSVMDKSGKTWSSWIQVQEQRSRTGDENLGKLSAGMFPPTASSDSLHLDRCIRIYPHLQDTGGFFITVLEKRSEIKARPEEPSSALKSETKPPPTPSTSIINTVNEIESLPPKETETSLPKLESLDEILPPDVNDAVDHDDPSAAARQNRENAPSTQISAAKRKLDAEADAESATKRPKFREEVDDPAPEGSEDRQVHWPPPPAAQLDVSHPETTVDPPATESRDGPTTTVATDSNENALANGSIARRKNPPGVYEEAFKYMDPNHPSLTQISTFYSLSPRFPIARFMVRNNSGEPAKTIYYTSSLARSILIANANSGIKFVHCGVKMFVKQDVQSPEVCPWRIQSEGLPIVQGWVGEERVLRLWRRKTLRTLLREMFPKLDGGGWRLLGEIGEDMRDISMGCCVLRIGPKPADIGDDHYTNASEDDSEEEDEGTFSAEQRMTLPIWRSLHSLNLMLPKEDRKAMLLRLYNDDTPLTHSKERVGWKKETDDAEHVVIKSEGAEHVVIKSEDAEHVVTKSEGAEHVVIKSEGADANVGTLDGEVGLENGTDDIQVDSEPVDGPAVDDDDEDHDHDEDGGVLIPPEMT